MKAATILPSGQEKQGMWLNHVFFEERKYQFLREAKLSLVPDSEKNLFRVFQGGKMKELFTVISQQYRNQIHTFVSHKTRLKDGSHNDKRQLYACSYYRLCYNGVYMYCNIFQIALWDYVGQPRAVYGYMII